MGTVSRGVVGDAEGTVPRKNHGGLSPSLAAVAILLTASLAARPAVSRTAAAARPGDSPP